MLKENIVTSFKTGIKAEFPISDEDYQKYTEIMNHLNSNPGKSETELFNELPERYSESVVDLSHFINSNMQNTTSRSMANNTVTEKDVNKLVRKFIRKNISGKFGRIKSIETKVQGIGSISDVDLKSGRDRHKLIIKFRFSNDYKTATVFQFKIDNKNINLNRKEV